MRILLTTDAVGGVWRYSAILSRALSREGHAVLLAVIGHPSDEQLAELPGEIELEIHDARLEWQDGAEADLGPTAGWLRDVERSWRPDILHLNQMTYTGLATFGAPTVVVVHSDVCSWFAEVRGTPAPAEWARYRELVRSGLRAADRVVAPSRYQADLVVENFGRLDVIVIHNGIDGHPAGAADVPAEPYDDGLIDGRRSDLTLSDDEPHQEPAVRDERPQADPHPPRLRLLMVGRAWDEAKGVPVLDEALVELGENAPEAHLVGPLAPPGSSPTWHPRRLIWDGELSRDETARRMAAADVYVAPSLYEPFGLAPVEAALDGCALLLSDIGSFRELWDGHAEFVERGSATALADRIASLCRSPERVRHLAEAAQKRAVERFNAARFAEGYLNLYTGLQHRTRHDARVHLASTRSR